MPHDAGSGDNSICIHEEGPCSSADIDPLQKPSFFLAARQLQAHPSDVNCVRWHPTDPALLASAGDDGSIRLWRYDRGADTQASSADAQTAVTGNGTLRYTT
jgi:WD40 repeat protein